MTLAFDHQRPIYIQLMEYLYYQICQGERPPESRLPSVRDFALETGVNPNTASRAYMELEREGIVESRRGQGTFVTGSRETIASLKRRLAEEQTAGYIQQMKQLGLEHDDCRQLIENLRKELCDEN
ncbi:GntR family transcriptional regulator [Alkalicoccus urumqiensis]|uniref:GntR family transcriptional regulator n=1 Tax=Alkalicoccus urumqiensis TaxID=1548213 RepID=A0A2P6MGG8_ALKUR|nr:GntR family transcriptional regulator [Alkalicoccus urumqiensis]PRO65367.1 GntR family transcriptional regulator [Alkalicoccus urumqiensis]